MTINSCVLYAEKRIPDDRLIRLWNKNNDGDWDSIVLEENIGYIHSVKWSPDGKYIISGSGLLNGGSTLRFWEQKQIKDI